MSPKILIADDHSIVRHGLNLIIKDLFPKADVSFATNFDALLQILSEKKLTLAICDVNMPGCNNFHMVPIIKKIQPELKTIIYSAYSENLYAKRFLKAGADAYIHKETENQDLIDAIHNMLHENGFSPNTSNGRDNHSLVNPITLLSDRELEVAHLLVKGLGTLEICYALGLNKTTISTYKKRIYAKMGISTIPELITIYRNYAN